MKFILLSFLAVFTTSSSWSPGPLDYLEYNARYTALVLNMPNAKIVCGLPQDSGIAKCKAVDANKKANMLCPTHVYSVCDAQVWVSP